MAQVVAPSKGNATNRKQAGLTVFPLCRTSGCLRDCRTAYAKESPLCYLRKVSVVSISGDSGLSLTEQVVRV